MRLVTWMSLGAAALLHLREPLIELPVAYRNCVTTSTDGALAQVKWPAR